MARASDFLPKNPRGPIIYQNIYVPAPAPHEFELPGNIPLYSSSEVADLLGISKKTVRRWIHEGRIAYTKLPSGQYRIGRTVVQEMLRIYVNSINPADDEEEW